MALTTAAFDARYEYHPPSALPAVEPTRADMFAHTARSGSPVAGETPRRGRKGEKCLVRSSGPMMFVANVEVRCVWESCAGDFSGCRMPGRQSARRR